MRAYQGVRSWKSPIRSTPKLICGRCVGGWKSRCDGRAGRFDLAVIGVGEEWGLMSHLFGFRAGRSAREWPGSLLVVRKHESVAELAPPPPPAQQGEPEPAVSHA